MSYSYEIHELAEQVATGIANLNDAEYRVTSTAEAAHDLIELITKIAKSVLDDDYEAAVEYK